MRLKLKFIHLWITVSFLFIANITSAQTKEISGKVTDATGAPVVGSTIAVENSNVATQRIVLVISPFQFLRMPGNLLFLLLVLKHRTSH